MNNLKLKVSAVLTLTAMAAGNAYINVAGFGELYDAPLSPLTAEAIATSEEYSVARASTGAEYVPTLTDEYITEVMSYERPHVLSEGISASGKVNPLSEKESISQPVVVRYALSDEERDEVERVMMAECGGEERDGMIAVGQCILNACEESGLRPHEAIKRYGYTPIRKTPSEAVIAAVSAVFDDGETVTDEPILYFYATYIYSAWHESQEFVIEIGNHRFFKTKGERTK